MLNHTNQLNLLLTDLYNKGKIIPINFDNKLKIELPEATIYFKSKRSHDIIKLNEDWNPQDISCSLWSGRWNSMSTMSNGDLDQTTLLLILTLIQ